MLYDALVLLKSPVAGSMEHAANHTLMQGYDTSMDLTVEELRVLCVLVEKSFTTPEQYPLTTNALVTGCNQKTSRDPVVNYSSSQVDAVMQDLRTAGWARTVRVTGSRTNKHKHVVAEKLPVDDSQLALLAVLGLRGAQSPGELKTRTERYVGFDSFDAVVEELETMAAMPDPLVRNVGTQPGQSQDRWVHLLGNSDESAELPADSAPPAITERSEHANDRSPATAMTSSAAPDLLGTANDRSVSELAETVRRLERRVAALESVVRSQGLPIDAD